MNGVRPVIRCETGNRFVHVVAAGAGLGEVDQAQVTGNDVEPAPTAYLSDTSAKGLGHI